MSIIWLTLSLIIGLVLCIVIMTRSSFFKLGEYVMVCSSVELWFRVTSLCYLCYSPIYCAPGHRKELTHPEKNEQTMMSQCDVIA